MNDGHHAAEPRGLGALLRTETERVDLGERHGRRLRARIEHRRLQLALGRRSSVGVTFGRRRVRALEVTLAPHEVYEVPVLAPPDPVRQVVRRTLLLALAAWAVSSLTTRVRHRYHERNSA